MFSNLFRKKTKANLPYTQMEAPVESIRFLGPPTGDGLKVLEGELAVALIAEGNTRQAFLLRVQYPGEERIRVALIIDGKRSAGEMAPPIARTCQSITGIDIMFFESLPEQLLNEVTRSGKPFYIARHEGVPNSDA